MALEFIAGCLGGCAGVAVGHPFDTVKVRLQTQDFQNPKYRGTWHCITDTIKHESLRGLYKGMSSPMAGVAFVNAIVFGVHGNMVKHIQNPDSLRSQMLCGAVAGFSQSIVTSPMELVKTRVQLQTEACVTTKSLSCAATSSSTVTNCSSYTSPVDCIRKIVTTEGWRGLFRGQLITVFRDVSPSNTLNLCHLHLALPSFFLAFTFLVHSLTLQ
uniref:Mitochondrial carrier protein n=1 Tax=Scylla olivacea TaxID=85551 RepID=A0A0P4W023_SCYOL